MVDGGGGVRLFIWWSLSDEDNIIGYGMLLFSHRGDPWYIFNTTHFLPSDRCIVPLPAKLQLQSLSPSFLERPGIGWISSLVARSDIISDIRYLLKSRLYQENKLFWFCRSVKLAVLNGFIAVNIINGVNSLSFTPSFSPRSVCLSWHVLPPPSW